MSDGERCSACYWTIHGDSCQNPCCPGVNGEIGRLREALKEMTYLYASQVKKSASYLAAAQRFGCLALNLANWAAVERSGCCTVVIREQLKEVREFLKGSNNV